MSPKTKMHTAVNHSTGTLFKILFLLFLFGKAVAQIPIIKKLPENPKVNEKQIKPLPENNTYLKNFKPKIFLLNSIYYIESNGFLAGNHQTQQVANSPCAIATPECQWKLISNTDGTHSWIWQYDNTKKLVYNRGSQLNINHNAIQGGASQRSGFALASVSTSGTGTNPGVTVIDKWFLDKVNDMDYWMVAYDRRDSFLIHLFNQTDINPVDFNFTSMTGWQMSGSVGASNAFSGQPSSVDVIPFYDSPVIPPMPLGGSYWKGLEDKFFAYNTGTDLSYINTSRPGNNKWQHPDETKTGTLLSSSFVPCGDRIALRIAGTNDPANIRFELLERLPAGQSGDLSLPDGNYHVVYNVTGHGNDITRRIIINSSAQKDKVCRFRIVDNSTAGHIVVDNIDLSFTGQVNSDPVPPNPVIPPSKPIWGAMDMHTHPMSYLGMGGKLMYGSLDGDPRIALGNCNCIHGGWGTDNTCGNYFRAEIINVIDKWDTTIKRLKIEDGKIPHNDHTHEGYPNFPVWPAEFSMTHQQMWWEWIKRAHQGGLNAIIALAVNSEVLGRVLGGDPPFDDKTVADREIDSLIAFVHRHRDFMDTVTSPARMRSVISSGKMAVIIGMEVDNLGNFYENLNVTEDMIRNEITRLKNKGVRYIFPLHVTDNKFGGAAVYEEFFNLSNKYTTSQPVTGTVPVSMYPPVLPGHLYRVEVAPDPKVTFRLSGDGYKEATKMRPLIDIIEAGVYPPELLPIQPIVQPVMEALKHSEQYQLAKKILLDPNPEFDQYDNIKISDQHKGGHRNVLGLSTLGHFAIKEMMRQGLMIDVDHASERTVNDIIEIGQTYQYPLNSGHNGLRGNSDNEKTRTPEQMQAIKNLGGMFGMGWERQTPEIFIRNYGMHLNLMGGQNTTFGSDIDGYAATPMAPTSTAHYINYTNPNAEDYLQQYHMEGSPRVWDYNKQGMAQIGMMPDFFEALKKAGASYEQLNAFFLSVEYFARMWERCETQSHGVR